MRVRFNKKFLFIGYASVMGCPNKKKCAKSFGTEGLIYKQRKGNFAYGEI